MTAGLEPFTRHLAVQAPPPLRHWVGPGGLVRGAADFLAPLWERVADMRLAGVFQGHCPVPGARASDYQTRFLPLPDGTMLMTGIRFRGGDMGYPFAEVVADAPLEGARLEAARVAVAGSFGLFRPRALRLWRFDEVPPSPDSVADQTYYAAPLGLMRAQPLKEGLTLRPATDMAFYPALAAAYAEYQAAHPAIGEAIAIDAEEELAGCLAEGLLFEAHDGGEWAGMIAVAPDSFFGLAGYLVREEFLLAPHRGQGLGVALQRHLAERLRAPDEALLFGTIHTANVPSRKTAERAGRSPIMTAFFIPLSP